MTSYICYLFVLFIQISNMVCIVPILTSGNTRPYFSYLFVLFIQSSNMNPLFQFRLLVTPGPTYHFTFFKGNVGVHCHAWVHRDMSVDEFEVFQTTVVILTGSRWLHQHASPANFVQVGHNEREHNLSRFLLASEVGCHGAPLLPI